jgi:hypothetical protein
MNVFEAPQLPGGRGFDEFPAEDAVREIRRIDFPNLQIVCVGTRVASAMAAALEISALPENRFGTFYPPKRGGEWLLGYITHPSGRRWTQPDDQGSYLTRETQQFLRKASQARG